MPCLDGSQKQYNPSCEEWVTSLPVHPAQERCHTTLDLLPPQHTHIPSLLCPTEVCCSQDSMLKANMESCQQHGHYSKERTEEKEKSGRRWGWGGNSSLLTFASNMRLKGERLPQGRGGPHHNAGLRRRKPPCSKQKGSRPGSLLCPQLPLFKARPHLGFCSIAIGTWWAGLLDPSPHASLIAQVHRDSVASHHGNSMNTGPPSSPSFVSFMHTTHKMKQEKAPGTTHHFSRSIAQGKCLPPVLVKCSCLLVQV